MIVNVFRICTDNIGDKVCSPLDYYAFNDDIRRIDVLNCQAVNLKALWIFGGGGLFHDGFDPVLRSQFLRIKDAGGKIVVWGAGSNYHGKTFLHYPDYADLADMIGVRDVGGKYPWVPCPTCCNRIIAKWAALGPKVDRVVYKHHDFPLHIDRVSEEDNFCNSLRHAIRHIARGRCVVTNSYHGAYWGLLLGRKVEVMDPYSSKFYGLPSPSPTLLEDCVAANDAFYLKVKALHASMVN